MTDRNAQVEVIEEEVPQGIPGKLTMTRLELPEDLPQEEWIRVGYILRAFAKGIQWWVGDWLAFGESHYDETIWQQLEQSEKTLANWATVARKVHPSRRRETVKFSHHAEVAVLPPDRQEKVLDKVEKEKLTVGQTRDEVDKEQADLAGADHGKPETVEIPECPTCGAERDYWKRVPEGVRSER